ncbi:MAG: FHA domain-containing protein [Polyangia bacterium]|nr:FHA domain-containing protein [Polyangia bacterium]
MFRIVARDSVGAEVGSFDLDEGSGSIILGRGETSHILLNHAAVSREHAFFYVSEGEVVIEDAGSAAGTLVDGYPIDGPVFVGPQNRIQIATFEVEVIGQEGSSVAVDVGFQEDAAAAGMPALVGVDPRFDPTLKPRPGLFKLMAVSGITAGTDVPLPFTDDFDLGRDQEMEISCMDPTVSRRHARLRLTEQGILVIDLRSMNGTYINGQRVKRQEAKKGDRLRFGEVAFELQAATAQELAATRAGGKGKFTRKHIILAGGGAMILVALLVLAVIGGKKPPQRAPGGVAQRQASVDSKLQRQFRETIAQARTEMGKRDWAKAKELLLSTQDIFARHDARDSLLSQVNEEMQHEQILKKANDLYESASTLESYESAKAQFDLIKPTSDYYGEARMKNEKVKLWLSKYYLTEGLTFAKGRLQKNRVKAAEFLCKYFDLLPEYSMPEGNEQAHREQLIDLEKKLDTVHSYRKCEAKRFKTPVMAGVMGVAADTLAELKKQHQLDFLVQALMLYFDGKLDAAIDRLRKLQDDPKNREHRVLLGGVFNKVTFIKGKYSEGTAFLQAKDLRAAQDAFDKALAKDAEIVPQTLRSYIKEESGRLLAEAYLTKGQDEYGRSRYQEAYAFWHRGKLANPNHVGVQNALLRLEAVARNWVTEAAALADAGKTDEARVKFEAVRRITEPGSRYYTQATQSLANLK